MGVALATPQDDLFHQVQVLDGPFGDAQQVDLVAPAVADISRDHHLGLGVRDAVAQGPGAEPGVDHAVYRADAGAGQHGDGALGGERHVDDHTVALAHAKGAQAVGEPVHLLRQAAVGEHALGAVLAQPDERRLVAVAVDQVAVQRVLGDVALGPHEPAEGGVVPLEHGVPAAHPLELGGDVLPEPLRRRHGVPVGALVVLLECLPHQGFRRLYLSGLL